MSVEETLAAIDAAVGCQQCGKPLAGSVSDDFDSEECQAEWHAARASRLVDDSDALESALATMRDLFRRFHEQLLARQRDELLSDEH